MSKVRIYPYINEMLDQLALPKTAEHASTDRTGESFQEIFANASRTEQAMAVDKLISASSSGSVDAETVEHILGFNPTPSGPFFASRLAVNTTTTPVSTQPDTADDAKTSNAASSTRQDHPVVTKVDDEELERCFAEAAEKYEVDENLLKAIAYAESNFDPNATSKAGAMGIMQLMPSTADSLGIENAYDVHDNILGGANVIARHLRRYDGDLSLALAAYNAGPGNVDKYNGIPPFKGIDNYINKILDYYNKAQG